MKSRAGSRWRLLAHTFPAGEPVKADSVTTPSTFDEVVVDEWLHVEEMETGVWWMNVGGVTIWIRVRRSGRPWQVDVYGPDDYADPVPGCDYRLKWSTSVEGVGL